MDYIKTDEAENIPVCCKRYYFYGLHSFKCQQVNGFKVDTNIHYAELNNENDKSDTKDTTSTSS